MELLMVGGVAGLEGSSWSFEAPVGRSLCASYKSRDVDKHWIICSVSWAQLHTPVG